MQKIIKILPGLLLALAVAIAAKYLVRFAPTLGASSIAIFFGIFLGNTIFRSPRFADGTKFSESRLLEYSIVILGISLSYQTIIDLGFNSILFILLQMTLTIIAVIFIGKKLQVTPSIYLLMASGNAVCGSSAVAATAPAVEADDASRGIVITIVNLMGTVLMLVLPLVALVVFQHDTMRSSALIGGVLQSVGQVVASASMVNDAVLEQATIFKLMRIIMLVVVVFGLGQYHARQSNKVTTATKQKVGAKVPWYVIGFFIACTANSFGIVPAFMQPILKYWSGWFEITALAAIGLRLDMRALMSQGRKLLIFGASVGVIQVVLALALIFILF